MKKTFPVFPILLLMIACNGFKPMKAVFRDIPPYEQYVESLRKAHLSEASMTREWLLAGQKALVDSVFTDIPFSESGFFEAGVPQARSYRFEANDGQVLTVQGAVRSRNNARVFLDLFVWDEGEWDHVAYGDSALSLTHEFSSHTTCLLRVQPELLADVWYSVSISLTPVLINPVYGASNKAIGSLYGAPRDNGKRKHEGIDIFAPRGTPVVAPTEGYVTRVGHSGLGGKVVWLKDIKRQHSYYFAHLDSQMVKPGMHVRQGHVLGLVGNTGNAKYTPPHLHFGIYQSGAKDPLHYIRAMEGEMQTLPVDTGFHQQSFKTIVRKAEVRSGPSKSFIARSSLERDTYVTVIGQSREWYRVSLPDKTEGYLAKKQVGPLAPGSDLKFDSAAVLLSEVLPDAVPIAHLNEDTKAKFLARFADWSYIVTENGLSGWILN